MDKGCYKNNSFIFLMKEPKFLDEKNLDNSKFQTPHPQSTMAGKIICLSFKRPYFPLGQYLLILLCVVRSGLIFNA